MTNLTEHYSNRRKRLIEQLKDGTALINSSGMAPDTMLHDRNLSYLTGYTGKDAYLLLAPNGVRIEYFETRGGPELFSGRIVHEILFVSGRDQRDAFMDGDGATIDQIQEMSGVDRVYDLAKMDAIIGQVLMDVDTLWLNTPSILSTAAPLSSHQAYINRLRERFYWIQFRSIAKKIHQMRFVKDDYEVECLREAFAIQTEIYEKIMHTLKPGDNESRAQAIFDYEITNRGQHISSLIDETYSASIIVGSGPNSIIPHYMDNSRDIQDGELVLIDSGVSVYGYFSDITRIFPVNGHFTPRQRELYAIVLEAENAAIDTMKPGSTIVGFSSSCL